MNLNYVASYNCQNVYVVKISVIKISHQHNKGFVKNSTLEETATEIFDPKGVSLVLVVINIYLKVSFVNKKRPFGILFYKILRRLFNSL